MKLEWECVSHFARPSFLTPQVRRTYRYWMAFPNRHRHARSHGHRCSRRLHRSRHCLTGSCAGGSSSMRMQSLYTRVLRRSTRPSSSRACNSGKEPVHLAQYTALHNAARGSTRGRLRAVRG
jgi:hypothetical protein